MVGLSKPSTVLSINNRVTDHHQRRLGFKTKTDWMKDSILNRLSRDEIEPSTLTEQSDLESFNHSDLVVVIREDEKYLKKAGSGNSCSSCSEALKSRNFQKTGSNSVVVHPSPSTEDGNNDIGTGSSTSFDFEVEFVTLYSSPQNEQITSGENVKKKTKTLNNQNTGKQFRVNSLVLKTFLQAIIQKFNEHQSKVKEIKTNSIVIRKIKKMGQDVNKRVLGPVNMGCTSDRSLDHRPSPTIENHCISVNQNVIKSTPRRQDSNTLAGNHSQSQGTASANSNHNSTGNNSSRAGTRFMNRYDRNRYDSTKKDHLIEVFDYFDDYLDEDELVEAELRVIGLSEEDIERRRRRRRRRALNRKIRMNNRDLVIAKKSLPVLR
ncbi:hypothetical protein BY996DRAFT_6413159 [Phakopsora pachyrhizi]|nr:hypothetical protein BY996DRAFT_6413159 [Phakopsora pachyrhizi]